MEASLESRGSLYSLGLGAITAKAQSPLCISFDLRMTKISWSADPSDLDGTQAFKGIVCVF